MMYTLELTKEQLSVIQQLCDIALRQGGLQNLEATVSILNLLGKAKEVPNIGKDFNLDAVGKDSDLSAKCS